MKWTIKEGNMEVNCIRHILGKYIIPYAVFVISFLPALIILGINKIIYYFNGKTLGDYI